MRPQTSRPDPALWNRLRPRYKLVASSPYIAGLLMLLLTIFPGGWLLATSMGISADEPVIRNPNGRHFMLTFCASMPVVALVSIHTARRIVHWWLTRSGRYSIQEVELALAWRAYPEAWLRAAENA